MNDFVKLNQPYDNIFYYQECNVHEIIENKNIILKWSLNIIKLLH